MSVDFRTTYTSLLKEPEVGKVRSPSYTLPDDSFTYGQFVSRDKEGAGEVINRWVFHSPTRAPAKVTDFRGLNKLSLSYGFHESRDLRGFRSTQSLFRPQKTGTTSVRIVLPEEEFAFGKPNRPSTPMGAVMSNKYGAKAANESRQIYQSRLDEIAQRRKPLPKLTNSAVVSKEKVAKRIQELNCTEQKPLFKIKKFLATSPRTETINKGYISPALRSSKALQLSAHIGAGN